MSVIVDLSASLIQVHEILLGLRSEVTAARAAIDHQGELLRELHRQVVTGNGSPSLASRITGIEKRCESTHSALLAERRGVKSGRSSMAPWVGVITALIAAAAAVLVAVL